MGRTIEDIDVVDVEKRKIPSKHYVYIIHVTWSDQSTNVIYRRYSRFFDFQSKLMDMFPEEAGALDPSKRIIPFLPGKKFFGRSHIREVALKRMEPIGAYCKAIFKLPRKISECKDVIEFFELEPDDINPPKGKKASVKAKKISQPKPLEVYIAVTDYKKQDKGEVTLKAGMLVEVVEKTETGWWFVNVEDEQGWVPSTCLEREDGQKEDTAVRYAPGEEQQYLCTEEFRAESEDEVSMERGAVVDVIEKNLEGWWFVRYNGKEGYVPATFLIQSESVKVPKKNKQEKVKYEKPKHGKMKLEIIPEKKAKNSCESLGGGPQIVKSLMEVSDLMKEDFETNTAQPARDTVTSTQFESDDDVFDDDDDYEVVEEEESIYTVQEVSKILKEGKKGCAETEQVNRSIHDMKSRSLTRYGSTRPPPRPSVRPGHGGFTPKTSKPKLMPTMSFSSDYVTIAAFSDAVGDGISFEEGQSVKVLEKNESGWWYIEIEDKEGWAPAGYIKPVEPAVNKPKAPSPVATKNASSPARSREDLTNIDREDINKRSSTAEVIGDLTNALKGKLGIGHKVPPTPPKKDFLVENDLKKENDMHSKPGKIQIPSGFALPAQSGLKKVADRNSQPPPPAPPADRHLQPPPPAPPVKTTSEPKPPPFGAALKPVPPKKVDTKPENKPKPILPVKTVNKPSEKPKPVLPVKRVSEVTDSKPKPPPTIKEQNISGHDRANGSVEGMANALKAKFSAMDNETPLHKPAGFNKPKPPVKHNVPVAISGDRTSNVSGITGALKAKFEAIDNGKSDSETHRPNANINLKPSLNLVQSQGRPSPPQSGKKPGLPVKPSTVNQALHTPTKPPLIKYNETSLPVKDKKPSWTQKNDEIVRSRKSESVEGDTGTHNVSDLANVLKAKFENRQNVRDSSDNGTSKRESKPLPPSKSGLKPFQKPTRPSTPPSPKTAQGRKLPAAPVWKTNSPVLGDRKSQNPQKYSSRPLPPEPKSPSKQDSHSSTPLPVLPVKPKSSSPLAMLKKTESQDSTDSEGEGRPAGVSNLADVLKAKFNSAGDMKTETRSNFSAPKFNQGTKHTVPDIHNSRSDFEKNTLTNENSASNNRYNVIADFAGHNEGEIKLEMGQEVELLETADGWSYVSSRGIEGWAPSSYLEEVTPGQGRESDSWTSSVFDNSNQTVYRVNADFIAVNDGELSVYSGQEVVVMETPEGGWWYVQACGKEGWVPASYIEEV